MGIFLDITISIFSGIIMVMSIINIILSGMMFKDIESFGDILTKNLFLIIPMCLMMSAGIYGISISLIGFAACAKRSRIILYVLMVLLSVLFIINFNSSILGGYYLYKSNNTIQKTLQEEVVNFSPSLTLTEIDKIQLKFKCCGVNGPSDYNNTKYFKEYNSYPKSCSNEETNSTIEDDISYTIQNVNQKGCLTFVYNWIGNLFLRMIISCGIYSLLIMLFLLFLIQQFSKRIQPYDPFSEHIGIISQNKDDDSVTGSQQLINTWNNDVITDYQTFPSDEPVV